VSQRDRAVHYRLYWRAWLRETSGCEDNFREGVGKPLVIIAPSIATPLEPQFLGYPGKGSKSIFTVHECDINILSLHELAPSEF
jgi:hypothetical protein